MSTATASRCALALLAGVLAFAPVAADAAGRHGGPHGSLRAGHGGHGHGRVHWGPGLFIGGLAIGIGLSHQADAYPYGSPWYPGYAVAVPPAVVYGPVPQSSAVPVVPPVVLPAPGPDPIVYPRNGQSPDQTEADRQACNRWATTQPAALADAAVFQRASAACLDGRGYSVR